MGVGAEALAVRLFLCQQRATTTPSGRVWTTITAVFSEPTSCARAVWPGFGTQAPTSTPWFSHRRLSPAERSPASEHDPLSGAEHSRGILRNRRQRSRRGPAEADPHDERDEDERDRAHQQEDGLPVTPPDVVCGKDHAAGTISGCCYFTVVVKLLPTVIPP